VRALPAAALAALALVAAGCGAGRAATVGSSTGGAQAAKLVPANALAFVSLDTDTSSQQLRQLDQLTSGLAVRSALLDKVSAALAKQGLDSAKDVKPALGPEVDLAVLGVTNGKPEAIALTQPADGSKLGALAAKFDAGSEHYTVQQVGGWSVVADSADAFAAVQAASKGSSLAGTSGYAAAESALPGAAIAHLYASKSALAAVPRSSEGQSSTTAGWIGAALTAESGALQLQIARPASSTASIAGSLLGDVPSGAAFAASFRGNGMLARSLAALAGRSGGAFAKTKENGGMGQGLGLAPGALAPLLSGDAAVYLRPSGLIPIFGLELRPKDPAAAETALKAVATKLEQRAGGALTLIVRRQGDRVYAADSAQAISDLRGTGPKLVHDAAFTDAVKAAGGGQPLLYANVPQLLPFVQALGPALGAQVPKELVDSLGRLGTVVAVTRGDATAHRLVIRLTRS
jgi:uncharacterized protein DUF3352